MSTSQVTVQVSAHEPEPFETCDRGHCAARAVVAVHTATNARLTFCGHDYDDLLREGAGSKFVAVCDTRRP